MTLQVLAQAVPSTNGGNETLLLWGFILFGAALLLLVIELFVPSGGLIGLLSGVAVIGSIVAFFMYDTALGAVALISYIVLVPIVGFFLFKFWLNSPLARNMILGDLDDSDIQAEGEGHPSMSPDQVRQSRMAQLQLLIGVEGETVTPLRPVGIVKIQGQRIDAMAESGMIDPGMPVVVTDVYDNQIKVRAL